MYHRTRRKHRFSALSAPRLQSPVASAPFPKLGCDPEMLCKMCKGSSFHLAAPAGGRWGCWKPFPDRVGGRVLRSQRLRMGPRELEDAPSILQFHGEKKFRDVARPGCTRLPETSGKYPRAPGWLRRLPEGGVEEVDLNVVAKEGAWMVFV